MPEGLSPIEVGKELHQHHKPPHDPTPATGSPGPTYMAQYRLADQARAEAPSASARSCCSWRPR
jgi:hypothetical protein